MAEDLEQFNVDLRRLAIVARKRSLHETRDLAVRVFCKEAKNLFFYYVLLALPVYLIDLVFWFFVLKPFDWLLDSYSFSHLDSNFAFFWTMTVNASIIWLTISIETDFVGSLATRYLGFWLFANGEKIDRRAVFRSWRSCFFRLFFFLVFPLVLRFRPYYAETILLERAPFRKRRGQSSIVQRVRYVVLEGGASGFFSTEAFYLVPGALSGCFTLFFFVSSLIAEPALCFYLLCFVFFPIFIFACKLYKVVFSFLAYINYRISCEGWDLRLAFESEVAKIREDEAFDSTSNTGVRTRRRARRGELSPLALEDEEEADVGKGDGK